MTVLPETDLFAQAFFLADHATVENGKIYTNGAFWNKLSFGTFPAVTTFSVVTVLHVPWRAFHTMHRLEVWFQEADGGRLPMGFQAQFKVGTTPGMKDGEPTIVPIAAVVGNFSFARPGGYVAVLEVDGAEIARWSFRASQVLSPTPSDPPPPSDVPKPPAP